jgi:integrase
MFLTKDSKSPYYQLVYCLNGKRTKISTKTSDGNEAEKFKASFKPGDREVAKPKKTSIKLSSFVTEYKDYVSNTYSESYLKKAVTSSFNRLQYYLPDVPIDTISARHIDQFISSVAATSKHAASLYHRTLKAAFNKAVVWNYLEDNPFNKIKAPKIPKSLPLYISETELIQILNNTKTQLCKDIFITAFYTGMRLGELLNMKWNWIDFTSEIITVKNSKNFNTKNKRERIIPVHPKVNQIIKRRVSIGRHLQEDYVFYRYEGVKLNEDYISKQFKKAVRASNVNEKIHFHSLRHSFASALVQRGVSLYAVKELLGHSNITTTQIYSHLNNCGLSQAVNFL